MCFTAAETAASVGALKLDATPLGNAVRTLREGLFVISASRWTNSFATG